MTQQPIIALSPKIPPLLADLLASLGTLSPAGQDIPQGTCVYACTALDTVSADLINALPATVKLIASAGVGTDHIDLPAARARGIAVTNTPVVTEDTADLTWALLMAACRRLYKNEALLRAGDWTGSVPPDYFGQRVHGKTLGIIGLGDIGKAVARRARGFDMTVLYHGPNRKPEAEARTGAQYCAELDDLLARSDIVSLNCPLTEQSHHLINQETLAKMKTGAVLINTGRGPLVDEAALVAALQSGKLAAAGLDVFEFEPQINETLKTLDQVSLLPHIGSATGECRRDMALRLQANINAFLATGEVIDGV